MAAALSCRETPADWDYLLTDVYPAVDREGLFSPTETKAEETARLAAAARESGRFLFALMAQGEIIESFAATGRLAALHEFIFDLRRDEILLDFLRRSFVAAARTGQLHVCEYLLRRGYPAARSCPDLAISLVDASVESGDDDDVRKARSFALLPAQCTPAAGAVNILSRIGDAVEAVLAGGGGGEVEDEVLPPVLPAPLDASLLFLARRGILDANCMRPHDGFTALHLAALHGACEIVAALVAAGADVNALAVDGETPLSCARDALRECQGEDEAREERFAATVAALEAAGALPDWASIAAASPGSAAGPRRPPLSAEETAARRSIETLVVSTGGSEGLGTASAALYPEEVVERVAAGAAAAPSVEVNPFGAVSVGGGAASTDAERARLRAERLANAVSATGGRGVVTVRSAGPAVAAGSEVSTSSPLPGSPSVQSLPGSDASAAANELLQPATMAAVVAPAASLDASEPESRDAAAVSGGGRSH